MSTNPTEKPVIVIPLGTVAHQLARQFASEQSTPYKRRQVYLNSLAVCAVNTYLRWLEIESNLMLSDSWHPLARAMFDAADLVLPGFGKLECCSFLPGETACSLTLKKTENRIGYIAVQFLENLSEVNLLGFFPALNSADILDEIQLENFQSLDNLVEYLYRLDVGKEILKEFLNDIRQQNDLIASRVQERLASQPISETVAQLERIYQTADRDEWRYSGGDVLAGTSVTGGIRERSSASIAEQGALDESELIEFQDLAEELLEKLEEFWSD